MGDPTEVDIGMTGIFGGFLCDRHEEPRANLMFVYRSHAHPRPPRPTKVIMIDERGNQIPL